MGEKKEIVRRYYAQGLNLRWLLSKVGITKNQYYYESSSQPRGRPKSLHALRLERGQIKAYLNDEVIEYIRSEYKKPEVDCGYRKMTSRLQLAGFYINHKKVYRLMKQANLLVVKRQKENKNYVQYRRVMPEGPLRLLEIDIKQVWLEESRRYAYILTIIDTFTRYVLYWSVDWHMKQQAVIEAWHSVITEHLTTHKQYGWEVHIEVRNDNGPQFNAKKLRNYLQDNYLNQVFTHPYTPQENGHIESFHAILAKALQAQVSLTMEQLKKRLESFYTHYNEGRIHHSIVGLSPKLFWQQWNQGNIERIVINEKQRKVKFKLLVPKQSILNNPAGNIHSEGVQSCPAGKLCTKHNTYSRSKKRSSSAEMINQPAV